MNPTVYKKTFIYARSGNAQTGASLYAAYFAMGLGMDPFGLKFINGRESGTASHHWGRDQGLILRLTAEASREYRAAGRPGTWREWMASSRQQRQIDAHRRQYRGGTMDQSGGDIEEEVPPKFDGVVTNGEACCWVVEGTGKATVKRSYTGLPHNDSRRQVTGEHENRHIRDSKTAHDRTIMVAERLVRISTEPAKFRHGATVDECTQKLAAFIEWDKAIEDFSKLDNELNLIRDEIDVGL